MKYESDIKTSTNDELINRLREIESLPAMDFMRNKEDFFDTIQELCDRDSLFKIAEWSMFNIDYSNSNYDDYVNWVRRM